MNHRRAPLVAASLILAGLPACSGCLQDTLGSDGRDAGAGNASSWSSSSSTSGGSGGASSLGSGGASSTGTGSSAEVDAGFTPPDAGIGTCRSGCGSWVFTTPLPATRNRHTATLLDTGKVLVAGGDNGMEPEKTCLLYNPSDEIWTATGSLNDARYGHTATRLADGRVVVMGGWGKLSGTLAALPTVEVYSPTAGTWTRVDSMPDGRAGHTATLGTDGRVYVAGGISDTQYVAAVESFNPATSTFAAAGNLAEPRYVHAAAALPGDKVMLIAGRHISDTLASVEVIDRVMVTPGVALPLGAWGVAATELDDTRALVTGGYRAGASGDAWAWHPTNATWGGPYAMVTPRWGHEAVKLTDGTVILVGGTRGGTDPSTLSACERYHPADNTFTDSAWMNVPRLSHTATRLADGRVLVVGGTYEFDLLVSAELFTPAP
ncbi:MAG: hypothetical protein HY904_17120 [Deltaproteobacteria bacterium]|nr:hypothetical protein [Deltaproteobacteria bacterium]